MVASPEWYIPSSCAYMHVRASTILSLAATYNHEVLLYVSSQDESRNCVRRCGTMEICPRPPMGRRSSCLSFFSLV